MDVLQAAGLQRAGIEKRTVGVRGLDALRSSAVAFAVLALAGCRGDKADGDSSRPPLRRPKSRKDRLDPEAEKELLTILDEMRGEEYLARVKAKEKLEKFRADADEEDVAKIAGYAVQLTGDARLEVRMTAYKVLMAYGRGCPVAVTTLVEVLGDASENPGVREGAARALSRWTGKDFGYRAWGDEDEVSEAAGRWKTWLEDTTGVIFP